MNICCEYSLVRRKIPGVVQLTVHEIKRGPENVPDGIQFEASEATGTLSCGDLVYIKGVGLATVGDVVRKERGWALISFINIQKLLDEPHHSFLRVIWVHTSILA